MSDLFYELRALRHGHLDDALDMLESVLAETPEHPEALFAMALARLQQGSTDEAHGLLRRAATLDPDLGARRATYLVKADFADEAAVCLEAVLEGGAGNHRDTFNLGVAYTKRRQWQVAHDAFGRALEMEPGYAAALGAAGMCERYLGEYTTARATLERMLAADEEDAQTHYELGHVHRTLGAPEAAAEAFERYLALAEEDELGEASYHLARCRVKLGDRTGAMKALREARQSGFYNWLRAREEPDLEPLHTRKTFQRWLDGLKQDFLTPHFGERTIVFAGTDQVPFVEALEPAFARVAIPAAVNDRDALAAAMTDLVDEAQQLVDAGAVQALAAGDTLLRAACLATEETDQGLALQTLLPRMGQAGIPAGTLALLMVAGCVRKLVKAAFQLDIYDAFGARSYGEAVAARIEAWQQASLIGEEDERQAARTRVQELAHTAYLLEAGCCGEPGLYLDRNYHFEPGQATPALREGIRKEVLTLLEKAGGDATTVTEKARDTFLFDRVEELGTEPTTAAATLVDLHRAFLRQANPEAARLCLRLTVEQMKTIGYHMNMRWNDFATEDLVLDVLRLGIEHRWPEVGRAALDFFAWANVDLTYVNWVSYRAIRAVHEFEGSTPPEPWPSALWKAAYRDDLDDIKAILEAGADVNAIDDDGESRRSALIEAAGGRRLDAVKLLVQRGADPNIVLEGWTPLTNAAGRGHADVVAALLEAGADPNLAPDEWTPLMKAAYDGRADVVAVFLEADVDFEVAMADSGMTAPLWAVSADHLDVVRVFLDHGVDVNHRYTNGQTLLHEAAAAIIEKPGVVRQLIAWGAAVNQLNDEGDSPLKAATRWSEHEETAAILLDHGAKINQRLSHGGTVLADAASEGEEALVELFIRRGAHLDRIDIEGRTPLARAAAKGHGGIVRRLLDAGADADIPDATKATALMQAALEGHVEVVELLNEHGVDLNHANDEGYTALLWAALRGHDEVARILLEAGADRSMRAEGGVSALSIAASEGHTRLVERLLDAGALIDERDDAGDTAFAWAAATGHIEVAALLLERGADVATRNEKGATPLSKCARQGKLESVRFLLEHGADIQEVDDHGQIPLEIAAYMGYEAVVAELIERGASVDKADLDGRTALGLAANQGHIEVVKDLLEAGADIEAADNEGATPFFYAAMSGQVAAMQTLLKHGANWRHRQPDGASVLLRCAHQAEVARLLLDLGADADAANDDGVTPLMMAVAQGLEAVATLLLERGANIQAVDRGGAMPLIYAAANGQPDMVRLLVEHGADIHATNNNGETAAARAHHYGHHDIVAFLEDVG